MKIVWKLISLIVLIVIFNGCAYNSYTGRYWLSKSSSYVHSDASSEDNKKIEKLVRSVAESFGFNELEKQNWRAKNYIVFGKGKNPYTTYKDLQGADAAISIILERGPQPSIGIKDYSNIKETEFMRVLKSTLEQNLGEILDMKKEPDPII